MEKVITFRDCFNGSVFLQCVDDASWRQDFLHFDVVEEEYIFNNIRLYFVNGSLVLTEQCAFKQFCFWKTADIAFSLWNFIGHKQGDEDDRKGQPDKKTNDIGSSRCQLFPVERTNGFGNNLGNEKNGKGEYRRNIKNSTGAKDGFSLSPDTGGPKGVGHGVENKNWGNGFVDILFMLF